MGEKSAASTELTEYLEGKWNLAPDDWSGRLARYLIGEESEKDLFAAASSSDQETKSGRFCEAWYYTGMVHLLAGDKKEAASRFRKCLATEAKSFFEFQLATAELKDL